MPWHKARAYFEISHELLAEALGLPEGCEIIGIEQSAGDMLGGQAKFYVYHPDLPEPKEGEAIPRCMPTFKMKCYPVFEDWHLETKEQSKQEAKDGQT